MMFLPKGIGRDKNNKQLVDVAYLVKEAELNTTAPRSTFLHVTHQLYATNKRVTISPHDIEKRISIVFRVFILPSSLPPPSQCNFSLEEGLSRAVRTCY
jgi:hypothetical protein